MINLAHQTNFNSDKGQSRTILNRTGIISEWTKLLAKTENHNTLIRRKPKNNN